MEVKWSGMFGQVLKVVLWLFFGVCKWCDLEVDVMQFNLLYVLIVVLIVVGVFIGVLILIVCVVVG